MNANILSFGRIQSWFLELLFLAPAILVAVTFHEFAHGAVAYLLGDETAKKSGRLSLNPIRHLDPLGTLMFVIFRFGWGKPVPVNGKYFRHPRWGMAAVSLAGPVSNFLMAFLLGLLIKYGLVLGLAADFVFFTAWINIILGVFNLLPLPPLDGSRLISAVLPKPLLRRYHALEGYGVAIIFIAIFIFPAQFSGLFMPFINFFRSLLLG